VALEEELTRAGQLQHAVERLEAQLEESEAMAEATAARLRDGVASRDRSLAATRAIADAYGTQLLTVQTAFDGLRAELERALVTIDESGIESWEPVALPARDEPVEEAAAFADAPAPPAEELLAEEPAPDEWTADEPASAEQSEWAEEPAPAAPDEWTAEEPASAEAAAPGDEPPWDAGPGEGEGSPEEPEPLVEDGAASTEEPAPLPDELADELADEPPSDLPNEPPNEWTEPLPAPPDGEPDALEPEVEALSPDEIEPLDTEGDEERSSDSLPPPPPLD